LSPDRTRTHTTIFKRQKPSSDSFTGRARQGRGKKKEGKSWRTRACVEAVESHRWPFGVRSRAGRKRPESMKMSFQKFAAKLGTSLETSYSIQGLFKKTPCWPTEGKEKETRGDLARRGRIRQKSLSIWDPRGKKEKRGSKEIEQHQKRRAKIPSQWPKRISETKGWIRRG